MFRNIKKNLGRTFLESYKRKKQKSFDSSLNNCLKTVRRMIYGSKYCFLITNSERPWPSTRMVQPVFDDKMFELWIGTNPTLRKIKEIESNPNVTIAFLNEKEHANLVIYGKAFIVPELKERKKYWIASWIMFFPGGPKGEDFISIKVVPEEMELMNFKRNIVPEPFGLKPVKLRKIDERWQAV